MAENMSFLPEDYLERRIARRTNIICITLFGVVMVGVVAAWLVIERQAAEVRNEQAKVSQQFEEAAKRLEQIEQLQARKQEMVHKAQIASVLVERAPRATLLAEIINHMPAQLALLEFELTTEVQKAPPPRTAMQRAERKSLKERAKAEKAPIEVPKTDVTIRMVGVAPTDVEVAQFITAMSNHEAFTDASLLYSEQTTLDERELRKFGIQVRLAEGVDLRVIEPTMVKRELKMDPMSGQIQITGGELVSPTEPVRPAKDAR